MIESIDRVVNAIGGFLYRPYIVPLFLLAAGLYFTIRTGLIQFRLFGESIRVVKEKPKEKGSISSFGALMVCLLYTSPSPRDRTRSRMPSSA